MIEQENLDEFDICPECRATKHINCTFEMLNEHDMVVDCQCSCRNP